MSRKEAGMKNKKLILLIIGVFIISSLGSFAETKKLRQIGRYTLCRCKGGIPTAEVMKSVVDRYAGDIKYGFDLVGYGDLYLPFMDQLRTATFVEKSLPIGDNMVWMLYRSRGRVKAVQDLEWAGKAPLEVFSFTVKKNYKIYEFIMPKPCGNVSLRKVEEFIPTAVCDLKVSPSKANLNDPITVDMSGSQHAKSLQVDVFNAQGTKVASKALAPDSPKWQTSFDRPGEFTFKGKVVNIKGEASTCEAKVYINFPPECSLTLSTTKDYIGKPIIIDASGSSDSDGQIVRAEFEITDEAGSVVDKYTVTQKPLSWEKVFETPGPYTVTLVVTDDFGGVSKPCRAGLEAAQKTLFVLVEAMPLWARGSYGAYLGARAGILYKIVPGTLDLVLSGGGAFSLKDEPWKSFFTANFLLNVHAGPVFFGGGAGISSKVKETRESDFELVGSLGFNLFDKNTSAAALFGELRVPVGEDRSFSDHHKLVLGFRFLF
jgi:hypothetical protein